MKNISGGVNAPIESCFKCCTATGNCSECSWSYTAAQCQVGTLKSCADTTYPCSGS